MHTQATDYTGTARKKAGRKTATNSCCTKGTL